MPKNKANIKEILAANLRENRKKKGLTQEKLAEMADMSLGYLATLELGGNFPSGEMLEKLANALDIQTYQLFTPTATPEGAMLHLEQSIIDKIRKNINDSSNQSQKEELELLRKDIISEINKTVSKAIKQAFAEEIIRKK